MEQFNIIPNRGRFADIAAAANSNFYLAYEALLRLSKTMSYSRGLYATSTALSAAWPTPKVGWWAFVGETFPVQIWRCETAGTWTNSGQTWNGGNIDLTTYVKQTDMVHLTEEEYEALSDAEKNNGKWYFIEED